MQFEISVGCFEIFQPVACLHVCFALKLHRNTMRLLHLWDASDTGD